MQIKQYPFYLKATVVLLGLILLVMVLNALSGILIPLAFAALISILLNPMFSWLLRRKVPRALAVLISLFTGIILTGTLFYLISVQVMQFGQSFPILKLRLTHLIEQLEGWVYLKFGITTAKQVQFIKAAIDNSQSMVGSTLTTFLSTISLLLLIPTYVFMFLYYKTLILNFLYEVFSEEHSARVSEILGQTKTAIQSYMMGLLTEMVIIAVLNSTALLILDVKYALLLGVLGAILNMLPVIGGIIAILLPVLIATVTKDGFSTQFGIIIAYLIIQFLDNNIIFPRFVSIKVQINALISLVVVFLGNALWGIPGMFLSLPLIAVVKIIFDRIDGLQPWGRLLGDNVPTRHIGEIWNSRNRRRAAKTQPVVQINPADPLG